MTAHEYKITTKDGQELNGVLSEDKKSIKYTIDDISLAGGHLKTIQIQMVQQRPLMYTITNLLWTKMPRTTGRTLLAM